MSCALNAQLDVQPADNICKHLWYLKTTVTPQDSVTSVLVHGWEIIAGSVDGSVRRFDVRMGRMYVDELHQAVTCVAASHDGLCVLAACLDSGLRLLDKDSGQLTAAMHTSQSRWSVASHHQTHMWWAALKRVREMRRKGMCMRCWRQCSWICVFTSYFVGHLPVGHCATGNKVANKVRNVMCWRLLSMLTGCEHAGK